MTAPQRRAWRAGLMTTVEPEARAARVEPAGIATGKFHGGVTSVTSAGVKSAPVDLIELAAALGVVVREIDGLG